MGRDASWVLLPFSEAALISALGPSWKRQLGWPVAGKSLPLHLPLPPAGWALGGSLPLWAFLDGSWVLLMRPPWRLRWAWRGLAVLLFSWAGGSGPGPCLEGPFARKMGDVEPRDPLLSLSCSQGPPCFLGGERGVTASEAHLGKGIQPQIWQRETLKASNVSSGSVLRVGFKKISIWGLFFEGRAGRSFHHAKRAETMTSESHLC